MNPRALQYMISVTVATTQVDYYPHLDIDPVGSFLLAGRRASRLDVFPRSDTLPSRELLLRNVGGERAIHRKCDLVHPHVLVIKRHHIAGHPLGRKWWVRPWFRCDEATAITS